jgi:hypothetical protein
VNGENGQALPLAILVLAIGSLVVAPFLGHAGATLTASRFYGQGMAEIYACDAGIEHAIWDLTRGGLADEFTGPGDRVDYDLPETVNGLTVAVSVTANATGGGGGTPGEIEDGVIDSQIFDSDSAADPDIIHVSGYVYAIVYEGNDRHGYPGYLKTVEITTDGQISAVIDTFEFENDDIQTPAIVHVSGDVYAIAYQMNSRRYNSGYLATVSIAADGQISNHVIDTMTFDSYQAGTPDIIHVSGDVYAIAYQGYGYYYGAPGYLKTVTIYPSGQISNYIIDSLTFENSQCNAPDIIHIYDDVYAIAYQGGGYYYWAPGYLKTVTISSSGNIGYSTIDSLEFDSSQGATPRIVPVAGDVYAIAYQGSGYYYGAPGYLRTVAISSGGSIGNSVIDSFEFDSGNSYEPAIVSVSGSVYAIAYRSSGYFDNPGVLKTASIAADGQIDGPVIDSLEFDSGDAYNPDIVGVSEGILAIAYRGPSNRGYIKTVGVGTGGGTEAAYEIVSAAGGRTVRAFVDVDGEAASIVSWLTE